MVAPLAELGQHSVVFRVADHALVRRRQDAIGHLSDLRRTERQSVDIRVYLTHVGFLRDAGFYAITRCCRLRIC